MQTKNSILTKVKSMLYEPLKYPGSTSITFDTKQEVEENEVFQTLQNVKIVDLVQKVVNLLGLLSFDQESQQMESGDTALESEERLSTVKVVKMTDQSLLENGKKKVMAEIRKEHM